MQVADVDRPPANGLTRSQMPVLVVDDNPGFLRVARAVLESLTPPFLVHTVQSGRGALAFLRREPPFTEAPTPAFVVLDLRLPDVDGPTVLRRIGEHETLRAIPVLVVSQAKWAEDEVAVREAGALDFRVKPSRVDDLRDVFLDFWEGHVRDHHDSCDRR